MSTHPSLKSSATSKKQQSVLKRLERLLHLIKEGKWEEATGTASPQVQGKTDKLWVVFDNWFSRLLPGVVKGNYWVLYVSDDYKVGRPELRLDVDRAAAKQGHEARHGRMRRGQRPGERGHGADDHIFAGLTPLFCSVQTQNRFGGDQEADTTGLANDDQ